MICMREKDDKSKNNELLLYNSLGYIVTPSKASSSFISFISYSEVVVMAYRLVKL